MIRKLILLMVSILLPLYSFSHDMSHTEEERAQAKYTIRTPLPQLADDITMKSPVLTDESLRNFHYQRLKRSLQTQSEIPKPNTWIDVGTLVAIVIALLVLKGYYGD
jgi:hypothetical protein